MQYSLSTSPFENQAFINEQHLIIQELPIITLPLSNERAASLRHAIKHLPIASLQLIRINDAELKSCILSLM